MKFEEALKAMRKGRKAVYREEVYWIDDDNPQQVVRYEFDDNDGFLDTSTICVAKLHGADFLSDNWFLLSKELEKDLFEEKIDDFRKRN